MWIMETHWNCGLLCKYAVILLIKLTPNQDSLLSVPFLGPTMLPDTESAHTLPYFIRTR